MTFETVATETPARAATSRIVIRELGSTRATVAVLKRYRQRLTGRKCRATLGGKPGWPGLECLGPCRQEMTQHAQHPEVRRYRHGAASGGSGGTASSSKNSHVTLTWWTNATAGDLKTVWQQAATAFHVAHPNVTIQVEPIQNEAFTTKV